MLRTSLLSITAFIAATALVYTPANAANTRSFVSASNGSDSNPCTRSDPCRSFQVAYANTVTGGEINTLDPGGYGALTINHSISVVSGLGEAGVLVPPGGDGITINAGPTDKISLRGLVVEGAGAGSTGIAFLNGGSLTISNVVVRNNIASGVALAPTANAQIAISDSLLSDNGGHGVYLQPSGSGLSVRAMFSRVQASHNGQDGFGVFGNFASSSDVRGYAADCVSFGNGGSGFHAYGDSGTAGTQLDFTVFKSIAGLNSGIDAKSEQHGLIIAEQSQFDILEAADNISNYATYGDNYVLTTNGNKLSFVRQ